MPEIPEHLSNDAKNFIMLCLQRDPLARPTAQKLLDHPFIRDQGATKGVTRAATRDAFPCILDGSRTPVKSWCYLFCSKICVALLPRRAGSISWLYSSQKPCFILRSEYFLLLVFLEFC